MTADDRLPAFRQEGERLIAEWGMHLPLVEIGRDGVIPPLVRGVPTWLGSQDAAALRVAIVVGERASGRLSALRWIVHHLPKPTTGVMVPGTGRPLRWSPHAAEDLRPPVEAALKPLNRGDARDLNAFEKHVAALEKQPLVVLVDLSGNTVRFDDERRLVALLRGLHERSRGTLRLVVSTAWWTLVDQTNLESDLVSVSRVLSVAPWSAAVAARLAERFPQLPPHAGDDLQELVASTGGQPALVEHLLRDMSADVGVGAFAQRLHAARERLRRYPPAVVTVWKQQLAKLLRAPDLRVAMGQYVEAPLRAEALGRLSRDLPLLASGWLGFDAQGRCGIRSDLHRAWARDVLMGVRK